VSGVPARQARADILEELRMDMAATELPGNVTCIRLNGRMDADGAGRIDLPFTANVDAVGHDAIIDLSGVTFIASMGIRLLISTARGLSRNGARMVLFGAQDLVRNVFEEAAIDQIIPVVATEKEALETLGR
jgi:anti-sigma B factor antagonist